MALVSAFLRSGRRSLLPAASFSLLILYGLAGCAPSVSPSSATPSSRGRTGSFHARLPSSVAASVQARPLYAQAQQACREQRYAQAAHLLQHLAEQPDMNAEEVAFARQQRALCLQDAGLPVPLLVSSLSPVPAMLILSPAHFPARPISPAEADCGPRALSLLCQTMGVKASLHQLRQWAGTTVQGTSMAGLAKAAKAVGLKTEGMQVSREALPDQDMPAIAWVNNNHFVALLSVTGSGDSGTAVIHDPNSAGEETIPQERLLRLCSGYLLLVRR